MAVAMTATLRDPAGDTSESALAEAYRALDSGLAEKARGLAQSTLIAARASASRHLQARALACLAHCDRVTSRLRRSADTARRAAQIFQEEGDVAGEVTALETLAHVCMLLGRNDEAVEAAVLCVRLSDPNSAPSQALLAHNCLGIAYCWAGNYDKANAALETALHLAARCRPATNAYRPTLNQLWVEACSRVEHRYRAGEIGALQRMNRLVLALRRLERSEEEARGEGGLRSEDRTVSHVLKGLYSAWEGNIANAQTYAERAVGSLGGAVTWLDALVRWVHAELAWAQGDWRGAEAAFVEMRSHALGVEHEQLACLAQQLLAQICECQGKHEAAMVEYKALRSRERRIASDSMTGRETIVDWQLGVRRSERYLEQALVASRQFERWSFEDALTGIANRRAFEVALKERLGNANDQRSITLAMIDVDKFKAVNDTYGHNVGDKVLETVAKVVATSVREGDLAARLAGDEFVVLFDAPLDVAEEICQRIQTAMRRVEWDDIAKGLDVMISIGLSQAIEGDSVESLVARSDRSMYGVKPGWVPTRT